MKALLLLLTVSVVFAARRFDGEQVLRIHPEHEGHLEKLVRLERSERSLDFWKGPTSLSRPVDVRVPKDLLKKVKTMLENTGMKYTVMVNDLQQSISMERSRHTRSAGFNFDDYNTYDEIVDQLEDFAESYPNLTSVFSIGASSEKLYIYGIKVGAAGSNKPAVFLEGQLHARDWIVSATLMYNIKFLLEGYGSDNQTTTLMDQVDFYFIPVTNVDGYVYTYEIDRMWKKTRSYHKGSWCFGVDANRNWDEVDAVWQHFDSSSSDPCSDDYLGPYSFSEPETEAVSDWVLTNSNDVKAYLSVQAYGEKWMTPYGWTTGAQQLPPDQEQFHLANRAAGASFSVGTIAELSGMAAGSSCDWAYTVAGIKYSYAIELRDMWDGYVLPADQIRPSADEFFAGLLVVAEQVAVEY
ncbi:carboxypeptidase A2-like [Branchiostoma floridae]|uniref:Carboxypeptidase A2-like n=1 Tax=Branchiostoma floridae TaxID=7739 RepID=A0A9J7MFJ9_BRAFL|nr:carboxypeptidase A2-like [Branchiostoma floridae]